MSEESKEHKELQAQLGMGPPSPVGLRRKVHQKRKIHLKKSNRDGERKNVVGLSNEKYPWGPNNGKRSRKNSHGQYQSTLHNS